MTAAVTIPLTRIGVPSAALFAALVVGIALALHRWLPVGYPARRELPRRACSVSTSARWSTKTPSARSAPTGRSSSPSLSPRWCSASSRGALLGLHRDVTPLTGSLALVAGGASGLVAIARELGGDDRVVSVVQYLRVGLVTASMPAVVTLIYHADKSHDATPIAETDSAPWYLSIGMLDRAGRSSGRPPAS